MDFFDNEANVNQYIEMTKDYKGDTLIEILANHLSSNSSLLELGMGPGKDLDSLKDKYQVTGSDNSQIFLDKYREKNSDIKLVKMDAVIMDIENKYNCIYSNKVLHHLSRIDLLKSIKRQVHVLEKDGIVFHTFWYGEGAEEYDGLHFSYYSLEEIKGMFEEYFDIIEIERYKEEEEGDSIYVIARAKGKSR